MEKYLIDFFLAAFLALCVIGIKPVPAAQAFSGSSLDRGQTTALRGVLCVLILFHHSSLLVGAGLSAAVLKRIGVYVVGVFYVLSGYGLMASWERNGLKGFWYKRFIGTILPYLILSAAAVLIRRLAGEGLSVWEILLSFVNGQPLIRYSWFILAILVFYVQFFVAGLIARKDTTLMIALTGFFTFFTVYALKGLGYKEYWYNAAWSFPLGMLWYAAYPRICAGFRRHSRTYLLLWSLVTVWLVIISEWLFWFGFLARLMSTSAVSVLILLLMFKLRSTNPILRFLGKISLEVYLIHGLVATVLLRLLSPSEQPGLFVPLLFSASILLAWLFHRGCSAVFQRKKCQ